MNPKTLTVHLNLGVTLLSTIRTGNTAHLIRTPQVVRGFFLQQGKLSHQTTIRWQ